MSGKTIALLASVLFAGGCQIAPIPPAPPDATPVVEVAEAAPSPPPVVPETSEEAAAPAPAAPGNLWERLRAKFVLPDKHRPEVRNATRRYAGRQTDLDRIAQRAEPYLHLIAEAVDARDMPTEIALLPTIESAFRPFAYSRVRAAGLWQFIPSTGRHFGLKQTWWYDGRRDVHAATNAALDYLKRLRRRFGGDWLLALAAYNCGEGTVAKAIRHNRRHGRPTDFWSLDLPRETRNYVPSLLALSRVVADPERFGIRLRPIPDTPYLTQVDVGGQIDLTLVAELSGLPVRDIHRYNPGFNRFATDPHGPHQLLLPIAVAPTFEAKLDTLPTEQRLRWKHHSVRKGESLSLIAKRYDTSVTALRTLNRLPGNLIAVGQTLLIPVAHQETARHAEWSTRAATTKTAKRSRVKSRPKRAGSGTRITVRVERGDSLWEIARGHRVSVDDLAAWNGLDRRTPLRPAQTLVVWRKQPPTAAEPRPAHPADGRPIVHYEVRKGDSLWGISRRFKVAVDDLIAWNNLAEGRYIKPGQTLRLYIESPSGGTS